MKFEVDSSIKLNYALIVIMTFLLCLASFSFGMDMAENAKRCEANLEFYTELMQQSGDIEAGYDEFLRSQLHHSKDSMFHAQIASLLWFGVAVASACCAFVQLKRFRCAFKVTLWVCLVSVAAFVLMMIVLGNDGVALKSFASYIVSALALFRLCRQTDKQLSLSSPKPRQVYVQPVPAVQLPKSEVELQRTPAVQELHSEEELEKIFNAPVAQPKQNPAKGMWFCSSCGSLNEGTAVCHSCGNVKE